MVFECTGILFNAIYMCLLMLTLRSIGWSVWQDSARHSGDGEAHGEIGYRGARPQRCQPHSLAHQAPLLWGAQAGTADGPRLKHGFLRQTEEQTAHRWSVHRCIPLLQADSSDGLIKTS